MGNIFSYILAIALMCYAPIAFAYIGPGLGTGAIVAVLGAIVGVLMLAFGILWYPLKKLYRRFWPKKQ
jgi:hypothetical protein